MGSPRQDSLFGSVAFRRLWAATAISSLGTFVGSLALAFTVVETLGATAATVAALAIVQQLSSMAAAPLAGLLADRRRRRALLVWADLVRAAALLSVPVAHGAGELRLVHLAAVSALTGAAN